MCDLTGVECFSIKQHFSDVAGQYGLPVLRPGDACSHKQFHRFLGVDGWRRGLGTSSLGLLCLLVNSYRRLSLVVDKRELMWKQVTERMTASLSTTVIARLLRVTKIDAGAVCWLFRLMKQIGAPITMTYTVLGIFGH